jgi:hypothetical protein
VAHKPHYDKFFRYSESPKLNNQEIPAPPRVSTFFRGAKSAREYLGATRLLERREPQDVEWWLPAVAHATVASDRRWPDRKLGGKPVSVDLSEIAALRERAKQVCKETERLRAERQQIYIAIDQSWERIKKSRRTLNVVKDAKWILDLKTCAKG